MPTVEDVERALETIVEKIRTDESLHRKLRGVTRTILFDLTDLGDRVTLKILEGTDAEVSRGEPEAADVVVTTDSSTLIGVIRRELNPISAYMSGRLKVKGKMSDLLKLQKIM